MKHFSTLIPVILLLIGQTAFAQKEIIVTPVNKQMSRGMQPGFMVMIPETKLKDVTSAYEKHLEDNTKAKAKEINGELINYGVVNKEFSPNPFIVYAQLLEVMGGTELSIFVTEDSLNFINESSGSSKVATLEKTLRDFAIVEYRKAVTKQLEAENDKLKELKKDLYKQESEENSNRKEISDKKRDNESYQLKIVENKVQQSSKTDQVVKQQRMTESIPDKKTPEYELAEKNLKKYEGEKKDLVKNEEKLSKDIDENNAKVRELERRNEELKRQQEESKKKIDAQEVVVSNVEAILNGIK